MPVLDLEMSPDQKAAHDHVIEWVKTDDLTTLTMGGYAGAGKTTVVAEIVKTLRADNKKLRIAFCCFTGKASLVLRRKLERAEVLGGDYCGTIHSLIYRPEGKDEKTKSMRWRKVDTLDADLIVLDEASMVDEVVYQDLCSYGTPILAVGDHGQLPPVSGALNLMADPAIRLEKIHRQAEGNPIVQMSMRAREGRGILTGDYGAVKKVPRRTLPEVLARYPEWFARAGLVLCGTNRTRVELNALLRAQAGFTAALPQAGEKVICLRNQADRGLFNGLTGVLQKLTQDPGDKKYADAEVKVDGNGTIFASVRLEQFGAAKTVPGFERDVALFDWGYAMTVHKAQGSEAPVAIVFDECGWMETDDLRRRWKYTAYTRAAEQLLIVG